MKTNNYLIYTRKSDDDANNQKNSIDYQTAACLQFAEQNTIPVASLDREGFIENGVIKERHTAFKTSDIKIMPDGSVRYGIERPKFQKLVQVLAKRQFAGVVCLCWDRISRNDQDAILVKKLIKDGIDFRFVWVDYAKSSAGALHMDIDGMFAVHHSRVTSERVRATYSKLRSEGKCTYRTPIGYLDQGPDNKPLDPERAPIKRIFKKYATGGWSYNELAKWAIQQGLTHKPRRPDRTREEIKAGEENRKPKVRHPISHKTIENVLKNPFYAGKLRHNGDVFDGIHVPLISLRLFNKVQAMISSRQISVHYVEKDFFVYRGFLRCVCGRTYCPYRKKGHTYYRTKCKEGCSNEDPNLSEKSVHEKVEELLGEIHLSDEQIRKLEEQAMNGVDSLAAQRDHTLDELHNQQRRIYKDIDYLKKFKISLLREQAYSPEDFQAEMRRLETELENVHAEMDTCKEKESEMLSYILTFTELVNSAKQWYKHAPDKKKHEVLSQVFTELVFKDKELAGFTVKEGYETLFKVLDRKRGAPGRNRTCITKSAISRPIH